ncbi:MAG: hypothetical protein FJ290_22450 [Planctomycetes bacterium]|nr:hypothetical protein [Planctomycetota bacterium]
MATEDYDLLVATEAHPMKSVSPADYLVALQPAGAAALRRTVGGLTEVDAVLWAMEAQHIRVVTALADYSDQTLERVAEKELELMDALPEFLLEFRVVPSERVPAFLRAGYLVVLEQRTERTDAGETREDDDA